MVALKNDPRRADRLFHALADATRRDILLRCLHDESSISKLATHYSMSFAAVQKHVAVLERAELITKERRGREQLVRGNVDAVHTASALLQQFEDIWRDRLDRLGEVLSEIQREEEI